MGRIVVSMESLADQHYNNVMDSAFGVFPGDDFKPLPPDTGSGFLFRKQLDDNLILICWKFILHHNLFVFKQPHAEDAGRKAISIIYLMEGSKGFAGQKGQNIRQGHNEKGIFVFGENARLKFGVQAGEATKLLGLHINIEWLKKEISGTQYTDQAYLQALQKTIQDGPLVVSTTAEEWYLIAEIYKHIEGGDENRLALKAKTLLLISSFFSQYAKRSAFGMEQQKIFHFEGMQQVDQLLRANVEKKLPELAAIAKEISTSVSTLKRRFKRTFGKNIYQYYLELKMNHAYALLGEKLHSVNEVAARLQYENVSGFIEMFKRHHGISPGSLIKEK